MTDRPRLVTSVLLCALLVGAALGAAAPTFWRVSTQAGFLAGEVENLSIDLDGRVRLAPALELVHEATVPIIWTLLADGQGGVWAGTGNQGQVLHAAANGETRVVFDAAELEVHALAARNGVLYAATSPDGKVYKVERDGSGTVFFDPDDRYVWSMTFGADGQLYVGTGESGKIYRVDANGAGTLHYETRAKNVTSLGWSPAGALLASTSNPGRVFSIEAQGPKGFVLLDSGHSEINALRPDGAGGILVAAQSGGGSSDAAGTPATAEPAVTPPVPVASVSTDITITAIVDTTASAAAEPASKAAPAHGAVFRIGKDGLADEVWSSSEDAPYAVFEDASGLTIGTGGKGKVFRLAAGSARPVLLTRAVAQTVTSVAQSGSTLFLATANPAKIFRLARAPAERGTYLSAVQDAGTGAAWGIISWRATTPANTTLDIATRSGNTPNPDDTWSDWSAAYRVASGDPIVSPRARFLQWRAVFAGKSASPELTAVTAAYLPRNSRPRVASVTVHPPGTVFQKPFPTGEPDIAGYESPTNDGKVPTTTVATQGAPTVNAAPTLGRRLYQKSLQTFLWRAEDDNGDRLVYDLFFRREGESQWKVLRRGLWEPLFTWDTTAVADGSYVVRVVASDAPANPGATALTSERESATFDVDNTPPTIAITAVRREKDRVRVSFTVRDAQSAMDRVELSFDANRWVAVYPVDGIADARDERYDLELDARDATSVLVRATDLMNNVSTASSEIAPGAR